MQEYRRSTLATTPPTQERNATLRLIQTLQGRLLVLVDQGQMPISLPLAKEEVRALKAMVKGLLFLYGEKPASADRTMTITDVGKLYAYLKQIYG